MLAFRHRAGNRRAPAAAGVSRQGVVELTMKGLLNRGNLILAISWAMAVGVFAVRGRTDADARDASQGRHARAVQRLPIA